MKSIYYLLLLFIAGCEFNYTPRTYWYDKYQFNDCSSPRCIEFAGQMLSPITGEGIVNASVNFKKDDSNAIIGTTLTDENGYFSFSFLPDSLDYEYFEVHFTKENYLDRILFFGYHSNFDTTYYSTNYMIPSGQLNVQLKNTNPYNSGDKISTYFAYANNVYKDYMNLNDYEFGFTSEGFPGETQYGKKVNSSNSYFFPLGETVRIYWTVTKDGEAIEYSEDIIIESNTNYVIEY